MKVVLRMMVLAVWLLLAGTAWANVEAIANKDDDHPAQLRQVASSFLQQMASGKRTALTALLVEASESRLQDKVSLMITRNMELVTGGDLKEELLDPVRIRGKWGLVVTRQQRPKVDRDKVKLSSLLLHKDDKKGWRVVPKVLFSDPALNVSRDDDVQALFRWYRAQQRAWTVSFIAPLLKNEAVPDAMQHLVEAPKFDIERLRDPFASYIALVSRHNSQRQEIAKKNKQASRRKEVMEGFDLSALRLVGIYRIHGNQVAMFEDNEGLGHTVRVGNYIGKYNGKITAIDETTVYLLEDMVNPRGEVEHKEVLITLAMDDDSKQ